MNKKFLIIIDMQNDFISGSLANKDAEAIVEPLCEYIKNFEGDIICTRDTHQVDYLNTMEGKHLPIEHCIKDTAGHCIDDRILKALRGKKYFVIDKPTFGTLEEWDKFLSIYLLGKSENYDIEICGTCTDICVISNALILKTMYSECIISVLKDLCAGTTKEHHEQALEIMRQCQIEVK